MFKIHADKDYFVNITDIAEDDIISSIEYITNILGMPMAADNLLSEIEKKEKILEKTPEIYPFVSDEYLARKGVKFAKVKNYILFYTINEGEKIVTVIRFLYGRRDWKNILKDSVIE